MQKSKDNSKPMKRKCNIHDRTLAQLVAEAIQMIYNSDDEHWKIFWSYNDGGYSNK
jgi:hypothetical protein